MKKQEKIDALLWRLVQHDKISLEELKAVILIEKVGLLKYFRK